jgi:sarcosine oxidase, subunit beta
MASTCDILILGGGVIGTSIACQLARRRAGKVVLLEKAFPGAGASGKAPGFIHRHHAHIPTANLLQRSLRVFEHFGEVIGGPPVFTRTGLVLVLAETQRESLLAVNRTLQQDLGIEIPLLGGLELLEFDPNVHVSDTEVAALDKEAGRLDVVQTVASFAESARAAGAEICQGVEVQRLVAARGKVTGVETNEGVYECGTLVLAAGPWSAGLAAQLKVTLPLQPARVQTALFRRPPDCGRRGVICADAAQGLYFKPGSADLLEAGMLLPEESERGITPDACGEAADNDWLVHTRQRLSRRYPAMHRACGRGGYSGLWALSPDGLPVLDRLPEIDGAWCAVGCNGLDPALAPAIGELLAEWIVTGETTGVDLSPFRLARFAAPV